MAPSLLLLANPLPCWDSANRGSQVMLQWFYLKVYQACISEKERNRENYSFPVFSAVRDSLGSRQLSTLQRSGSATKPLTSMDSARGSSGHRSVHPAPLVTQHNKGNLVNTALLLNRFGFATKCF